MINKINKRTDRALSWWNLLSINDRLNIVKLYYNNKDITYITDKEIESIYINVIVDDIY